MVMKKAFTMLELIMVIIVLGIVASIGADIIVSLYNNYIKTRTINALETKTEVTLEQIAKRFQYRIKDSTIARKYDGTIISTSNTNLNNDYKIIEWIGYSNESFFGTPRPGWSGFIDMDASETNSTSQTLKTSDSNLTLAQNIIQALTNSTIDLTAGKEAALVFKKSWNYSDFGWADTNNTNGTAIVKVKVGSDIDLLEVSNDTNLSEIYEQYYLSHTAYAIVPEFTTDNTDFNLTLKYNYQPWLDQNYDAGSSSVLVEHANLFHFMQDQTLLRFKLCIHDNNESGIGERVVVCKEKVVY
jgi:prepilin-type N-terminal cleavage/methylation domain-containing protein